MMKFSSSKRNMKFLKEIIWIKLLTANNVGLYNTIFFWPFTVSPGEKDKLMQKNALFGQKTLIRWISPFCVKKKNLVKIS